MPNLLGGSENISGIFHPKNQHTLHSELCVPTSLESYRASSRPSAVNRCLNKEASFKSSSVSRARLDEVQTKTEKGQMVYI